jgi:hypothetical protein
MAIATPLGLLPMRAMAQKARFRLGKMQDFEDLGIQPVAVNGKPDAKQGQQKKRQNAPQQHGPQKGQQRHHQKAERDSDKEDKAFGWQGLMGPKMQRAMSLRPMVCAPSIWHVGTLAHLNNFKASRRAVDPESRLAGQSLVDAYALPVSITRVEKLAKVRAELSIPAAGKSLPTIVGK